MGWWTKVLQENQKEKKVESEPEVEARQALPFVNGEEVWVYEVAKKKMRTI